MNDPGFGALTTAVPRSGILLGDLETVLLAAAALLATAFFAALRSALLHSVPARILERVELEKREGFRPLLERAESLATSASIFEIAFQIVFLLLLMATLGTETLSWTSIGAALLVSVPLLVFVGEVLPAALRGERADAILRSSLPAFDRLQRPISALIVGIEAAGRATMRLLRVPETTPAARRIVEDLRDVVEDSDLEGELDQTERELIENVFEVHDVHVDEVMTPRTEVRAVEVNAGIDEIIRTIAATGHTRIPVYEKNLDTIVGVAYAQELVQLLESGELEGADVRRLLRPVSFVPETKPVSELLSEFRRDKQKLAVVLDEYGGTSGVVTMGDIVAEIVGDVWDELDGGGPEPIRRLEGGVSEVLASTRVSEVNEELDLELPEEEDYETLAGFVLAQLGHFPKRGESFHYGELELTVTEANDRRVLAVRIQPSDRKTPQKLA